MKPNWMAQLASHYQTIRKKYPNDKLLILFDIDDTIIDISYLILDVLQAYDKENKTKYFRNFSVTDIDVHENQVNILIDRLDIPENEKQKIIDYYEKNRWKWYSILQSHKPFSGVLEVIRWFQLQENTFVGLNTGRPEIIRDDTLKFLNILGQEFKVQFTSDLLYMNPNDWETGVENAKVAGIRKFQNQGYRVFGFVDNEPVNINVVSKIDPNKEILLLHANTIFESKMNNLPKHTVDGEKYELTEFLSKQSIPQHIQFVWHGINSEVNLENFLFSDITWGECDVRINPFDDEIVLRHSSFVDKKLQPDEELLTLDILLSTLTETDKSLKVDLKAGVALIERIIKLFDKYNMSQDRLWFNGMIERLQKQGFQLISQTFPNAIIQCSIDFLGPLAFSAPEKAIDILNMFQEWGINRFSINWKNEDRHALYELLERHGLDINLYNIPDLEAFLQAALLVPRSITSDFDFPQWRYYGRGTKE